MIANMNHDEFIDKLKKLVCYADWHHRYYMARARKYNRFDYWIKSSLGFIAAIGAVLSSAEKFRIFGAILAGGCAFLLGSVLPNFRWDAIVSGLKEEQEEWTRIFQGYEGLLNMAQISDRDEMLSMEFQKVEELKKAAELNERNLPDDEKLLRKIEEEVRKYHKMEG
jgi:hypothetical protein